MELRLQTHQGRKLVTQMFGEQLRRNKRGLEEMEYQLREFRCLGLAMDPRDLASIRGDLMAVAHVLWAAVRESIAVEEGRELLQKVSLLYELLKDIEEFGVL